MVLSLIHGTVLALAPVRVRLYIYQRLEFSPASYSCTCNIRLGTNVRSTTTIIISMPSFPTEFNDNVAAF
jgi:hypothetical protein